MLIVKRQRAVGIELQRFALGAEREAIQRVGLEEMFLVVERQRPKAVDRRRPASTTRFPWITN